MRFVIAVAVCGLLTPEIGLGGDAAAPAARMNQVQVLGSHNSYKLRIDASLLQLLKASQGDSLQGLEYGHRTLEEQLDLGLRSLEIDVLHDPESGRYAQPWGLTVVREKGLPAGPPYDPEGLMKKPGLKVLHVQDIDFRTSVYTFRQALTRLKQWSDRNPQHLPVVITMNAKQSPLKDPRYVRPLPFDRAAFDAWDAEIREMLPAKRLITPDDVRGSHKTLEEAVLAHAWPAIDNSRGRFLFVLDETGPTRETYLEGHPSLRGRAMFANVEEGRPEAAFRIVNDPKAKFDYIQRLVRAGYLVRTRADADTREARLGDYSRWEAALASGAQVITTDYYEADPELKTGYKVRLPGGRAGRWNTLLVPSKRPQPPE